MASQALLTLMDEGAVLGGALVVVVVLKAQRPSIRGLDVQLLCLCGFGTVTSALAFVAAFRRWRGGAHRLLGHGA